MTAIVACKEKRIHHLLTFQNDIQLLSTASGHSNTLYP